MDIEVAHRRLAQLWDEYGDCRSCGFHASLYEYSGLNGAIREALDGDGVLRLPCLSGEGYDHRGARIPLSEQNNES